MSDTPQEKKPYTERMREKLAESKKTSEAEAAERMSGEAIRRDLGGKPGQKPHGKPKPHEKAQVKPGKKPKYYPKITFARLPDGSRYETLYDGKSETWSGTLTVPGHNPFTAKKSAVHKLLTELDQMYRRSIQPATETKPNETNPVQGP